MSRTLSITLLISLFLHLAALFVADELWYRELEVEAFRARLLSRPKFLQAPRPAFSRPDLPQVQMEYLPSDPVPGQVGDLALADGAPDLIDGRGIGPPGAPRDAFLLPKAAGPELIEEELPSPVGEDFVDAVESEAMELLDLETMARVDRERAVVIPDPTSKRDLRGYVNFTLLRLDGAGGYAFTPGAGEGKPVVGDLARYLRDYTQIWAALRPVGSAQHFLADELLKDPVHFLFPMPRHDGSLSSPRVAFDADEEAMLARYLKNGGFLFADAGGDADGRRFLKALVIYLRRALGGEGRLLKLPRSHAIYHAFYDYESGFPGERYFPEDDDVQMGEWYYPDRAPNAKPPRGLWGVEWQGEVVAILSDLELHRLWSGEPSASEDSSGESGEGGAESGGEEVGEEMEPPRLPFLQAATNVVAYALTRPRGVAVRRMGPAWEKRRPEVPVVAREEEGMLEEELFDGLDGSLALVHSPLGKEMKGGLHLTVDGRYELELVQGGLDGVLLHNLAAGKHWIELEYAGKNQRMEVELKGGRVLTVGFKLRGLGFLTLLTLNPFVEQVWVNGWKEMFPDLAVEEAYFDGGLTD
jgi:hypothetical protein